MSGASTRCKINREVGCPVASTCGIYIGLHLESDPKTHEVSICNRYDFYTMTEKDYLRKWNDK